MAKSTRSKVKRSFRAKKRESGIYAATEAARLNRLHAKLVSVASNDHNEDPPAEDQGQVQGGVDLPDVVNTNKTLGHADEMDLDTNAAPSAGEVKRISTHGPRGSRRESWRKSKGLGPKVKHKGTNRQDTHGRKAGHSKTKRH